MKKEFLIIAGMILIIRIVLGIWIIEINGINEKIFFLFYFIFAMLGIFEEDIIKEKDKSTKTNVTINTKEEKR